MARQTRKTSGTGIYQVLRYALSFGAGVRQFSRLTGVSFGVIQKLKNDHQIATPHSRRENRPHDSYSNHKSVMKRTISKSLHGYFMQRGLDAVRDGGIVAFITTRNYLDSQNVYRLNLLFEQADLVTVLRLPDNLFKESANTEAGSDLIIIQI